MTPSQPNLGDMDAWDQSWLYADAICAHHDARRRAVADPPATDDRHRAIAATAILWRTHSATVTDTNLLAVHTALRLGPAITHMVTNPPIAPWPREDQSGYAAHRELVQWLHSNGSQPEAASREDVELDAVMDTGVLARWSMLLEPARDAVVTAVTHGAGLTDRAIVTLSTLDALVAQHQATATAVDERVAYRGDD